ncbi:hypothetical protein ACH0BF_17645 [Pseudobacillus sp. 179-B 2D1 NHS]
MGATSIRQAGGAALSSRTAGPAHDLEFQGGVAGHKKQKALD